MRSARLKHFGRNVTAIWSCVVAVALFTAVPSAWAQSNTADQPEPACIAIMAPTVEGVPGSAVDAAKGVSDLVASYLQGPSLKAVALEAKLPSLAAEEAKQRGCEPLLITSLHRKSSSHGLMKAFGRAAGSASWSLPYGGGSAASTVARAGTTAGLQTVSSLAESTKARDEVSFEYRLQSTDGQIQFGPKTERRTAKADGEDLLTPVVRQAAETIVSSTTSRFVASPAPTNDSRQTDKPAISSSATEKRTEDDVSAGAVQYLDHLKSCTPYAWKYPPPLAPANLASSLSQNIIRGKKGDKCQVTYLMPNNLRMECEHSPATINRMTNEEAYKAARAGEFSFSFSSNADDTVAKRECHL